MTDDLTLLRRRLHYQAGHRGAKELDLVLGNFAEKYLDRLSLEECQVLDALLSEDERQTWAWLIGEKAPPGQYQSLIEQLQQHSTE